MDDCFGVGAGGGVAPALCTCAALVEEHPGGVVLTPALCQLERR